ncbi:undecaprenyldiphospho-muramoylpentapeptide beta-N-acetylglucosaminyltransferase [Maridesulfovibrio ferrireducens]|uniref:undecaprenyldiphospho-muramoylpentapeptide beta-N-acetylglucosaminyltransferase n=1 Tax=Maridesulfovibrio ferrireducens TaxID=246191 RepID=UPI001A2EFBD3|nr:undecaprenyldiphospho-muramoylpentapeptide beta-N-acetylglucosaminyltransferase [Maridesulfovibrio ferrireducens]MBI9109730.1 undecaprenyldiphospho-muramoylpentapeptide beta-N-acetylglucosaminyltransferase [Maridesulfovibrio ferrireducens]
MKRIIITTGGTGGHVFPALAVAAKIQEKHPHCEILFLGGKGPEKDMVRHAGIEFIGLPAKGVLGGGFKRIFGSFWIFKAFVLSIKELVSFKPEAVIGFGGYAGFCPVLAAWMLGIPTAIHEQNSIPGITNRILGKISKAVFTSFEDENEAFPAEKVDVVGNPVRKEIIDFGSQAKEKNVLIFGGSQGATAINNAVIEALPILKDADINLRHQTGKEDFERVKTEYKKAAVNSMTVSPFIHDMSAAYSDAQLVVCRAGASTVFEIAAAGKPAIFIPFPQATHDHQTANADSLEKLGAAKVIPQNKLTGKVLAHEILNLILDQDALQEMAKQALKFARPEAAAAIVDGLEIIIRMKKVRGLA